MKLILALLILFSFPVFADEQQDVCSNYLTQRKCESSEATSKKCKWLKSKEICKNEDILKSGANEQQKGLNATEDESSRPSGKRKKQKN